MVHGPGREWLVVSFTVQLELFLEANWVPVVRYDNAHGFCHRDTLHPDGTQDKEPLPGGDTNHVFTSAIAELKANSDLHQTRYLREIKP